MCTHGLLGEDVLEEPAACGEDNLMCPQVVQTFLAVISGKGAIKELALLTDTRERLGHIFTKFVPAKAELVQ